MLSHIKQKGQFYTKKEVAKSCTDFLFSSIESILPKDNVLFLEPSAGYGCFYDEINKRDKNIIGFDIEPKHKEVKKIDFLSFNFFNEIEKFKNKNIIVIGNPPFGKKSKLAIDFINRSSLFSDIICFILPNQFKKYSTHSKLNKNLKLIKQFEIKKNSFYTEKEKDYDVNCVFQIWTNLKTNLKDLRIKDKPKIEHKDFKMFQYNNTKESLKIFENDFDFGIFSQGYGDYKNFITEKKNFNFKKQYLLFKAKNKKVLENLKKLDFEKLSKNNTTVPGFRKNDVVVEYIKMFGE